MRTIFFPPRGRKTNKLIRPNEIKQIRILTNKHMPLPENTSNIAYKHDAILS